MATPLGAANRVQHNRGFQIMFANQNFRRDFAPTRALGPESVLSCAGLNGLESVDANEQMAVADAADSQLLRMVMCVATATLVLALVSSMA